MDISTLNIWAILLATVVAFITGGLWYSPLLFANIWMQEAGLNEERLNNANMGKIFGLAFIFILIMSFCLAMFLNDPAIDMAGGAFYGFLTGFSWISMALAVNSLYERKSWKYMLINGGYWTIVFTLMGLILGGWN
ncbi:MAG: DUF1761 domain-containing protein [Balneolaceae bacterium]|nr:DUF1761 domain-containing protein [Balneolaceae bacterium]